jgi:probable rRNA maturation factor
MVPLTQGLDRKGNRMLSRIARRAFPGRAGDRIVPIAFVSDREMKRLAGRWRGSPFATDVLAFPYRNDPELAGEVIISLDTAKRQARERGVPLVQELALLIIHGLLHVGGQGDETRQDWRRMRVLEFERLVRGL